MAIRKITDPGTISQTVFDDDAGVNRVGESGHSWSPVGAIDSAKLVGEKAVVAVYNGDTAVHFVAFGDESVLAPTGPESGFPVPTGPASILNSGPNRYVIADSADVYAYVADSQG